MNFIGSYIIECLNIYISLGVVLQNSNDLEIYSSKVLDTVSKNVIKYRKQKALTQMELALEIGMSG